ncbi:MAG: GC-type dockerin domain-anchored protein [Phycisphaerales bacterium]
MQIGTVGIKALACGVLCGGVVAGSAVSQVPSEWVIELQCRSSLDSSTPAFNLPFPSSLSSQYVSIGEAGDVAIRVFLGGSEGVFYGSEGVGGVIFSATAADPVWSTTLDLRNGMIAIEQGGFGDGAELYDTAGNLIETFTIGGSEGVAGFGGVTLTSDGAICYRADFGATGDKLMVDEFLMGGRVQTSIANTFDGNYSFLFAPEINDARQVVTNTIPLSGPSRRIVQIDSLGSTTTVAETGGVWSSFVNSTAIAQNGDVAFSARRSAGSIWETVRWDGDGYTTIADGNNEDIVNGSFANFPPAVSSNGWVVLRATDQANDSTAVWVGDGESLIKLVSYDQMVETDLGMLAFGFDFGGTTGKQVTSGVVDINDAGQVAFSAFLRNGTVGVFVATPVFACSADLTGEGDLNFLDVSAFLAAFGAGDSSADFEADGNFNFLDVSAFLSAFAAGCP